MGSGIPMTEKRIKACYDLAKQVYKRQIETATEAADILHSEYGMDEGSALTYINFFQSAMKGEEFKRGVNSGYIEHCAKRLYQEGKTDQLKTFLQGVKYYVEYRRGLGEAVKNAGNTYTRYSEKLGLSQSL